MIIYRIIYIFLCNYNYSWHFVVFCLLLRELARMFMMQITERWPQITSMLLWPRCEAVLVKLSLHACTALHHLPCTHIYTMRLAISVSPLVSVSSSPFCTRFSHHAITVPIKHTFLIVLCLETPPQQWEH